MYDQYGSSRSSSKKVDPKPSKSSGFGGMGPDPAERFGGSPTKGLGSKPTFNFGTDDSSGADNNPNRDEYESKGIVAKLYDRAVTTLRNFGADEPEDVIVDGQRVYQGPLFRGYTPDTSNLFVDNNPNRDRRAVMPNSKINMFGVNTDNPSLNMFGVLRNSFRNPSTELIPPVLPESPANMDPMTRTLSQAMIPQAPPVMVDYEVGSFRDTENLMTIVEDLKRDGVDITLEELAKANDLPVNPDGSPVDPFVQKGEVIKVPVQAGVATPTEFMDKETKAMLQEATPIKSNFIKDNLDKITQSDLVKLLRGEITAEEVAKNLGINVETDTDKITTAVKKAALGAKQDTIITTDDTEENITAYQNKLNSLGFYSGRADGAYGRRTKNGIKMYQQRNGLEVTGEMNEETANRLNSDNSIVPTSIQVGNLTVSTAYRDEIDPSQLVIATDFNGGGPNAKFGAEVVLPPAVFNAGAGNQHYDAAVKYLDLVKDFFEKKGYGEYVLRDSNVVGGQAGIKRSGQNPSGRQSGRANTIHLEGFFGNDTKAANIVNENKEEFFDLYIQAFGNTTGAILIAPHGRISDKNKQDQGAVSPILGTETDLGDEGITHIINKYGNK